MFNIKTVLVTACAAAVAYDIQDKWRKAKGLKPVLAEFNRLMLKANCSA